MRLFLLGDLTANLTELDDIYTEIIVTTPDMVHTLSNHSANIRLVVPEDLDVEDDVCDQVSWIDIAGELPEVHAARLATSDDLAILDWDDSELCHRLLRILHAGGVAVYDAGDELAELVYDETPDMSQLVKQITTKVTEEVLRIIRAELEESRPRRTRQKARQV